jgi:Asp-tRNA(Asn)/Glu-tRNA(Gln) amidotransferase A subunit family amidase
VQKTVMSYEIARSLGPLRARGEDRLSARLRELIAEGERVPDDAYRAAKEKARACRGRLGEAFAAADVLLTASAVGEAPPADVTGDPALNRIWTLLGTPCLHLPTGRGPAGLPVGIQLVGGPGGDAALIAAAAWAEERLRGAPAGGAE